MTKKELLKELSEKTGLSQRVAEEFLTALVQTVTAEARDKGRKVRIMGLGTFYRKCYPSKKGFNPLLKKDIVTPPMGVLGFKASEIQRTRDIRF